MPLDGGNPCHPHGGSIGLAGPTPEAGAATKKMKSKTSNIHHVPVSVPMPVPTQQHIGHQPLHWQQMMPPTLMPPPRFMHQHMYWMPPPPPRHAGHFPPPVMWAPMTRGTPPMLGPIPAAGMPRVRASPEAITLVTKESDVAGQAKAPETTVEHSPFSSKDATDLDFGENEVGSRVEKDAAARDEHAHFIVSRGVDNNVFAPDLWRYSLTPFLQDPPNANKEQSAFEELHFESSKHNAKDISAALKKRGGPIMVRIDIDLSKKSTARDLASAIRNFPGSFERIALVDNNLDDEGGAILVRALHGRTSPRLNKRDRYLGIIKNFVGDLCALEVARLIKKSEHIRCVDLRNCCKGVTTACSVGNSGAILLAKALRQAKSLEELDLSHHGNVGDGSVPAFVAMLNDPNSKLRWLNLAQTDIREQSATELLEGLSGSQKCQVKVKSDKLSRRLIRRFEIISAENIKFAAPTPVSKRHERWLEWFGSDGYDRYLSEEISMNFGFKAANEEVGRHELSDKFQKIAAFLKGKKETRDALELAAKLCLRKQQKDSEAEELKNRTKEILRKRKAFLVPIETLAKGTRISVADSETVPFDATVKQVDLKRRRLHVHCNSSEKTARGTVDEDVVRGSNQCS